MLFTGRELDPATGLYYYDARWYGPHLGQFVSRDVIATADANPYRYVRSSPMNFTDPSGRGPCGQPVWDADLGRYVDPLYEQWAAEARARQRLAAERESQEGIGFWDWVQGGLDAGGVVEPTPFCDLASGVISAFRGNWADAGCSALAMIPYVGDTAKAAKYGRKAAKLANRAGDVAHAARAADNASDAAKAARSTASKEPAQLARGKRAHQQEPVRPGEVAEVQTPSGKRMDRYNAEEAHIREIKPDNARAIRAGEKQVERYKREMEAATGRPHTTEVSPYDPSQY